MYIERILYPVYTLGIGRRIAVWTQGCFRKCEDCANPELWEQRKDCNILMEQLYSVIDNIISKNKVDGITISGGEPFLQIKELEELIKYLKKKNLEILVYTGYKKEELQEKGYGELLDMIDILIDGEYIREYNYPKCVLRGSTNQHIYYRTDIIQKAYEKYLSEGRKVQNIFMNNQMLSVGIHNKE